MGHTDSGSSPQRPDNGSAYILAVDPMTISSLDGKPSALRSVDLAESATDITRPVVVTFTGAVFGWGGSVSDLPQFPYTPVGVQLFIVGDGFLAFLETTDRRAVLLRSAPKVLESDGWYHVALSGNTMNCDAQSTKTAWLRPDKPRAGHAPDLRNLRSGPCWWCAVEGCIDG